MPPRSEVVRVGIAGAGWVATHRHLPAYLRLPGVAVVGIYDRHPSRARALARKAGPAVAATESFESLLALEPDLVSVATPPQAHAEMAVAAMQRGVGVFLEKPVAMSFPEARAMAAAAADGGRVLCVSHNLLFSRAISRMRRELASGAAGPVRSVLAFQSSGGRRLPDWYPELPGGLFFDESPHMLYLMGSILGRMELVAAHASRAAPGSRQPLSAVQALFTSAAAPATLSMTFDAAVSEWHLVVVCERRMLAADLFRDIAVVLPPDGAHRALQVIRTSAYAGLQHVRGVAATGARVVGRRQDWGHGALIEGVVSAVRLGRPSPVPIEEALQVARLTDDILNALG